MGPWSVPKPPGGIGWPWGSRQYWAAPRGMEMTPSLRVQWWWRVSRKALGVSLPAIREKPWATVFKRKKGSGSLSYKPNIMEYHEYHGVSSVCDFFILFSKWQRLRSFHFSWFSHWHTAAPWILGWLQGLQGGLQQFLRWVIWWVAAGSAHQGRKEEPKEALVLHVGILQKAHRNYQILSRWKPNMDPPPLWNGVRHI